MPGVGGTQFAFKDETSRTFKLVMLLLFTNLVGSFGLDLWVKHLAPRLPNASGPISNSNQTWSCGIRALMAGTI
jgi:hypothetical protein